MIQTEKRGQLVYVVEGLKQLMAALVDPDRTTAICREQARADCEEIAWICEFETNLEDGTRIEGSYIPAETPGFRSLQVLAPDAPLEDQKRMVDEYHAIPPTVPARD